MEKQRRWDLDRRREQDEVGREKWRIIISGGGTGGHLFPGLAVGEEICRRRPKSEILFITGRRKMERFVMERSGFLHASIAVEGIKGRGWVRGTAVILKLPLGFLQSLSLIKRFSPHLVIGVGGYSSGPACLAARILGLPTAIHEQNSFPGLTNRLLCRVVDRVFISFEESRDHFPGGKLLLTGNPIRQELLKGGGPSKESDGEFTVLAVGGSQGARAINDALLDALEILKGRGINPSVIHQTGEKDFERVKEAYEERGLKGDVMPFINDMAKAYGHADIVIGRAGASTVSELAALGIPSVLIPYPHAANRHQETNALLLVRAGGADMILQEDLTGRKLADLLEGYMNNQKILEEMGRKAVKVGRRDAAEAIVDRLEALAA